MWPDRVSNRDLWLLSPMRYRLRYAARPNKPPTRVMPPMPPMRMFAKRSKQSLENMRKSLPWPRNGNKVVYPNLDAFWQSKDNSAGNTLKGEKDMRIGRNIIIGSRQGWTLLAQIGELETGQAENGLLVSNLWCLVMG